MKRFTFDEYGLLCQPRLDGKLDGGDSVRWSADYMYLSEKISMKLHKSFLRCNRIPGVWVRHFDKSKSDFGWASYYQNDGDGVISRDQLTGILCYLGKMNLFSLNYLFINHLRRLCLFAFNVIDNGVDPAISKKKIPDLTGPDIWALYIRGFRSWWLYPLLLVFDIHLLIGAIIAKFKKDPDIISMLMKLIRAKDSMPTPLSWMARKMLTKKQVTRKLHLYWSTWRHQPGMPELYLDALYD